MLFCLDGKIWGLLWQLEWFVFLFSFLNEIDGFIGKAREQYLILFFN